jgi:N-acetylmuramoyl-L-alanine amidase
MKIIAHVLSLIFLTLFFSREEEHVEVTAQAGEGIYALLREFQLSAYSCNFKKFYELNGLQKNATLREGKKYALPIQKRPYNGKSIRTSLGISDYQQALRIQYYNEAMHEAGLREKPFLSDKVLWVPHHLLHCAQADVASESPTPAEDPVAKLGSQGKPVNVGKRVFPIFGPEMAYTPLLSNALQGRIFYLISGHGGPDPGAMGKRAGHTLCEDEYAYDVTLRLCRKLVEHGATAYMIVRDPDDGIRQGNLLKCDKDELIWGDAKIAESQIPRLRQRTEIINALYAQNRKIGLTDQQVIEIHVDSRSHREQVDLFFYYQEGNERSQELAEKLHGAIRNKYRMHRSGGGYEGTISTRGLYTLREVTPPAVYIELGNIRNGFDQQRIVLGSNRGALANWLLEGLLQQKKASR